MPERDDLDRLIDSELARYAEPRDGLERRILARVEAESPVRSWVFGSWRSWAMAGAVAASIVLVIGIQRSARNGASVNTASVVSPAHSPVAKSTRAIPEVPMHVRHLPSISKPGQRAVRISGSFEEPEKSQYPKLDEFPARQPLSTQEQSLVALSSSPSDVARENLISSRHQMDAPLQISAIEIPPINQPDLGSK